MSVNNIPAAGVASSIGKSNALRDAPAGKKDALPVFSRSADGRTLPGLAQACQVNGHIPNSSFRNEAAVGDLMRTVRDIRSGDLTQAKQRLDMMAGIELGEFFANNKIDPSVIPSLQKALNTANDPKAVLSDVLNILEKSGASRLSPKLRPE